jgi:hypothetical protein
MSKSFRTLEISAALGFGVPIAIFALAFKFGEPKGYAPGFITSAVLGAVISCLLAYLLRATTKIGTRKLQGLLVALTLGLTFANPWSHRFLVFNFTNEYAVGAEKIDVTRGGAKVLALAIPYAYFEAGKIGRCDFGREVCLEFAYPSMSPAGSPKSGDARETFKVVLFAGPDGGLRFFGEDQMLESIRSHKIDPSNKVYGLRHYTPSTSVPFVLIHNFYVPDEEAPSFVFTCESGIAPDYGCRRQSTRDRDPLEFIYWIPDKDLSDWRATEERVAVKLRSFIVPPQ